MVGGFVGWSRKKHLTLCIGLFYVFHGFAEFCDHGRACFCWLEWNSWSSISDIISREILRLHILFNGTGPFWGSGRHSLVQWWLLACGERCSVA
jgi:hypothetical protein